jgi:hypothetical protein
MNFAYIYLSWSLFHPDSDFTRFDRVACHLGFSGVAMNISEEVQTIVEILHDYSGQRIADVPVLSMLLQHAGDAARNEELGALCFRAKHVSRVFDTLARHTPETELHAKLQEEFSASIREFHTLLDTFISGAAEELHTIVSSRHLAVTPDGLRQLMTLARDLEWLKNWELDINQRAPGA